MEYNVIYGEIAVHSQASTTLLRIVFPSINLTKVHNRSYFLQEISLEKLP